MMPNAVDKELLRRLQNDFPVCVRPYAAIARDLGLSEAAVINRVRRFCKAGTIRYIAAVFDPPRLGLRASLVAMQVPREKLARTVAAINRYPQVTHNYLRQGPYNLWFTVTASSQKKRAALIRQIKKRTGISRALDLATRKVFKIDARFAIENPKRHAQE